MTQIKVTFRGNEVRWQATFLDFDGQATVPASAKLYIVYPHGNAQVSLPAISMTPNTSGIFSEIWDSSVSSRGTVFWSVRASGQSTSADGSFELSANAANPDPA